MKKIVFTKWNDNSHVEELKINSTIKMVLSKVVKNISKRKNEMISSWLEWYGNQLVE